MGPPRTNKYAGQHRGEHRTDRRHQALLERGATFASPNAFTLLWSMTKSYRFLLCCFFQLTSFICSSFTNLHMLNRVRDVSATLPMAEKALLHGFLMDAHEGYNLEGGKGLFSVVCDCAHRDKAQKQENLWDIWDFINQRLSHRMVCPVKHFKTGHIPTEHSRSHPRTSPL